jgi:hypothetical protein
MTPDTMQADQGRPTDDASTHGGGRTRKHKGRLEHVGPESDAPLLTVDDVAAMVVCSTRTVRRMADSGQMPRPLKILSLCRWPARTGDPMTGILDWIDSGCPSCRQAQRRAGNLDRMNRTLEKSRDNSVPPSVKSTPKG